MQSLGCQYTPVEGLSKCGETKRKLLHRRMVSKVKPEFRQGRGDTARCQVSSPQISYGASPLMFPTSNTSLTRYPGGEFDFNMAEYMVELDDKPIGLTLAPDPCTGQITVQSIQEGSPADRCGMIQVGDIVKQVSATFGEELWQAVDIRRVRWAINNRTSKIKLILERPPAPDPSPTWYSRGKAGRVSRDRELLQLPVSFTSTAPDDWPQDLVSPGRQMMLAFHNAVMASPTTSPSTAMTSMHIRPAESAAARSERLQLLRDDMAAARREPELELGQPATGSGATCISPQPNARPGEAAARSSSTGNNNSSNNGRPSSASKSPWPHSSSSGNGTGSSGSSSSSAANNPIGRLMEGLVGAASGANNQSTTPAQQDKAPAKPKRKKVTPVLPWLLVSSSRLDTRDLTQIASHRGLSAILELSLCRGNNGIMTIGTACEPSNNSNSNSSNNGGSGAPQGFLSSLPLRSRSNGSGLMRDPAHAQARYHALISTAAALQRLAVRRSHGGIHHSSPDCCHILLHCCEEGFEPDVAAVVAAWLHWYGHMPLQEALLSAELALGCQQQVEQGLLEGATRALVSAAEESLNKVVLTWRYGGFSASVAGDVVGSWSTRMPLTRCKNPMGCKGTVARGNFYLELTGLRPGVYYYKYIIDGTWAVDPAAPKVLDASGNWNNVLEVSSRPPVTSSRERLSLARWHAGHVAWEAKMGLR